MPYQHFGTLAVYQKPPKCGSDLAHFLTRCVVAADKTFRSIPGEYIAGGIYGHRSRMIMHFFKERICSLKGGQQLAGRTEFLHAVPIKIGYKNIAARIHPYRFRPEKLTFAGTGRADFTQVFPLRTDLPDTPTGRMGQVHNSQCIHG
ncbi:MAG: hypothetical protein ACO1O1_17140 [Adhaeribacter sp.]